MNMVFLKLSDGWFSIWAVIEEQNILYPYMLLSDKVMIGTKLCICLWNLYPLNNILDFCSKADVTENICIEFFYNGSIILKSNAKLGFTK